MTDNEIISIDEAIRHCYETYFERDDLYRKEHKQLAKWLEELKESHNTINRQASENERLALELDISKALHKEAVAERNFYCHQMIRFESMFKTAKSEAIKEFVEKLKKHSFVDNLSLDGKETVYVDDIDNLVKEMTEEE